MTDLVSFLPLLILLIIFYWLYRKYSKNSLNKAVNGIPVGVGGWLFVLVLGMLILNPLNKFGYIEKIYSNNGGTYNGIEFTVAIYIFIGMVSIFGGWNLAKGKTPTAVTRAKISFWVQVIAGALILPITTDGGIALFQSIIVATIWTFYLSKSKRVKATYNIEA